MHWFENNQKKAIVYFRHSAEDKQENSVAIQRENTHKFAEKHDIEIINEETDEGKTGLLADRPGFNNLFDKWILNPDAPAFDYVLVYDVSRWGRFQDQDEAAFYEFQCKQRGKQVIYVARGFPQKENQFIEHLITSVERFMAAEYSRQLSEKVFHGCVKVTQQGYSAGGPPCYGMARLLLDVNKQPVRILKDGEHKSIANERVTFIPKGGVTTETVKYIFYRFVTDRRSLEEISDELNIRKIFSPTNNKWNSQKVLRILINEVYIGSRVYNKTSNRLKRGKRRNPQDQWVVCQNAFPAIIEKELFIRAKEKLSRIDLSLSRKTNYIFHLAQRNFIQALQNYLLTQGMLKQENVLRIQNFPVVFSMTLLNRDNIPCWCFTISEPMRRRKYILGIGVIANDTKPADQFFLFPTEDFSCGGFLIFSQTEKEYNHYLLPKERVDEVVISLAH